MTPDLSGISRRTSLGISQRFGMSSTMLALGGLTGVVTLPQLAKAAESSYQKRFSKRGAAHAALTGRRASTCATC
jgi:hypothetical protein